MAPNARNSGPKPKSPTAVLPPMHVTPDLPSRRVNLATSSVHNRMGFVAVTTAVHNRMVSDHFGGRIVRVTAAASDIAPKA